MPVNEKTSAMLNARKSTEIEKRLRESEERYNALVGAFGQVVCVADRDGKPTGDLASWSVYTGQSGVEQGEVRMVDAIHPDDRQRVQQSWRQGIVAQESFSLTYRLMHAENGYQDIEFRVVPVLAEDKTVREWISIGREREWKETQGESESAGRQSHEEIVYEQRNKDQQIKSLVEDFQQVFDLMSDGIFIYGPQGNIVYANNAIKEMFAVDKQTDFLVLSASERAVFTFVRDGEGRPLARDAYPINRIMNGETLSGTRAVDLLVRILDGRDVQLRTSGMPLYDKQQRLLGGLIVFRDVTGRRLIESGAEQHAYGLAERANQLEAILASMADAVLVYDRIGTIRYASAAARDLFPLDILAEQPAVSVQERLLLGRLYTEDGQILAPGEAPIERLLRGESLLNANTTDIVIEFKNGQVLQVSVSGSPIRDAEGQISGAVLIARDVTRRRQLERRTQKALEGLLTMAEALVEFPESSDKGHSVEAQLAELTCNVLDCQRVRFLTVEPDGERLQPLVAVGLGAVSESYWWNEQTLPEIRLADLVHSEDIERLRNNEVVVTAVGQIFAGSKELKRNVVEDKILVTPMCIGEHLIGILTFDESLTRRDETRLRELVLVRAIAKLSAMIIERQRLLREHAEAQGREVALREANLRMEEFLGIASHELRTPLTTIKANIQLALRRLNSLLRQADTLPEEATNKINAAQDMLMRAELQVGVLNRLVSDLIDISRIQTGRLRLHIREEPAALEAIVREAVEEQRKATPKREIGLHVPEMSVPIIADAVRIVQVITNFLSNALKYSQVGKPVDVWLEVVESNERESDGRREARVSIHDQGPGLTGEEQQRVWECFYQSEDVLVVSGSGVGLGLGLYVNQTLIERHSGRVGVESRVGQGSTFWFTLPLAEQAQ